MTVATRTAVAVGSFDRSPREAHAAAVEKIAIPSQTVHATAQAADAQIFSKGDDELAPWVATPDGGLEWRGW